MDGQKNIKICNYRKRSLPSEFHFFTVCLTLWVRRPKNRGSFHARSSTCLFITESRPRLRPNAASTYNWPITTIYRGVHKCVGLLPPLPPLLCPTRSFTKHQEKLTFITLILVPILRRWVAMLHVLAKRWEYCNHLKTKHRLLYLSAQSVPRSKHFSSRL